MDLGPHRPGRRQELATAVVLVGHGEDQALEVTGVEPHLAALSQAVEDHLAAALDPVEERLVRRAVIGGHLVQELAAKAADQALLSAPGGGLQVLLELAGGRRLQVPVRQPAGLAGGPPRSARDQAGEDDDEGQELAHGR